MNRRLLGAARRLLLCAGLIVAGVPVAAAGDAPADDRGAPSPSAHSRAPLAGTVPWAMPGKPSVKVSPEAVLDMMYSSFNPVFQPALLSRASKPEQPVRAIEDMRQKEFFQRAIAERVAALPWIKVTADGRMFPACPVPTADGLGQGWQRLSNSLPASAGLRRY